MGDQNAVGKTLGKDAESGKLTCISVYGMQGTRSLVKSLHCEAVDAMKVFGTRADFFIDLVNSMVDRTV